MQQTTQERGLDFVTQTAVKIVQYRTNVQPYGEIAIDLTSEGGWKSVFVDTRGDFKPLKNVPPAGASVNIPVDKLTSGAANTATCDGNVLVDSKRYTIKGYSIAPLYASGGDMVSVSISACKSDDVMTSDFHARKWAKKSNGQCLIQLGRIGSFGSYDSLSDLTEMCVFDTPCIYGYLGDIRFDGPLLTHKIVIGNFSTMYDCAKEAVNFPTAFAAVMENPYNSDPPYKCFAIGQPSDAPATVVQDSAYMTCYLKGRSICPANDYAPESPGAWMKGVQPSYVTQGLSKIAVHERGHCIKVLFEEYRGALIGYSAYTDSDGVMWCIPWMDHDTVDFVNSNHTEVDTCLFETSPFL